MTSTSEAQSHVPDSTERPQSKAMPKMKARRDSGHRECFTTDHLSYVADDIVIKEYPATFPVGTTAEEAAGMDIPTGSAKIPASVIKVFKDCLGNLRKESVEYADFQKSLEQVRPDLCLQHKVLAPKAMCWAFVDTGMSPCVFANRPCKYPQLDGQSVAECSMF